MSLSALLNDLTAWETLFLAGRLHKPVVAILGDLDSPVGQLVEGAMRTNRMHATRVALWLLEHQRRKVAAAGAPAAFDDFAMQLVALSYAGDFRMATFGEDPNKIANIARGQHASLLEIYAPLLEQVTEGRIVVAPRPYTASSEASDGAILAGKRSHAYAPTAGGMERVAFLTALPQGLQRAMQKLSGRDPFSMASLSEDRMGALLSRAIAALNRRPTFVQAAKGILSIGPAKALCYGLSKAAKRFKL